MLQWICHSCVSIRVDSNLGGSAESRRIYLGMFFARCDFYAKGASAKRVPNRGGRKKKFWHFSCKRQDAHGYHTQFSDFFTIPANTKTTPFPYFYGTIIAKLNWHIFCKNFFRLFWHGGCIEQGSYQSLARATSRVPARHDGAKGVVAPID